MEAEMEHAETARTPATSACAARGWAALARPWLIGAAVLALAIALYAGWDWLAALGVTTVLIAFAPCLAMCALGLCMGRQKKGE
jgi:hypothetical protein